MQVFEPTRNFLRRDDTGVLGGQGVGVGLGDGVVVAAGVLANVGGVAPGPWVGVEGALGALRDVVLADDVGDEHVASHVGAAGTSSGAVVLSGGLADGGALAWVVWAGEGAAADEGVDAVLERSVDGTWELSWAGEVGVGWWSGDLVVAVGAGDHDLEVVAPLALVGGGVIADWSAVENTLDHAGGGWVVATNTWVDGWVTLVVDVEGPAVGGGITLLLALDGVVGSKSVVAKVTVLLSGTLQVGEGETVALRSGCTGGCRGDVSIGQEGRCGVWRRDWAVAIRS